MKHWLLCKWDVRLKQG